MKSWNELVSTRPNGKTGTLFFTAGDVFITHTCGAAGYRTQRSAKVPVTAVVISKRSGFVVMDVDVKNDQPGKKSFIRLQEEHGKIDTLACRTPSGGGHIYLRYPASNGKIRNLNSLKGYPGIEVKGINGCVTLPGSFYTNGQEYVISSDHDIADCPEWLTKLLITAENTPQKPVVAGDIHKGNRDISLFKIACAWRSKGMDFPEIFEGLLQINKKLDKPLPEQQVREKAESACTYPSGGRRDPEHLHINPGEPVKDYGHAVILARHFSSRFR